MRRISCEARFYVSCHWQASHRRFPGEITANCVLVLVAAEKHLTRNDRIDLIFFFFFFFFFPQQQHENKESERYKMTKSVIADGGEKK